MSATTGIEWTDATWNPVVGCTKVSQGCKHCYAKTIHDMRHTAHLAGKKVAPQYARPFESVQLMPERLGVPLSWKSRKRVFVNSVSDLFHDDVPDAYLDQVFGVMALARRQTFQVLTKRPARMLAYLSQPDVYARVRKEVEEGTASRLEWDHMRGPERRQRNGQWWTQLPHDRWPLPNVWLGVSVENQAAADERIPLLLETPAAVRFLSCEPLLGPVDLRRVYRDVMDETHSVPCIGNGELHWVIIGGESGKGARPMNIEWVRSLVAQCKDHDVPPYVKQMGDAPYHSVDGVDYPVSFGRHGADFDSWEESLRVREFPAREVHA